VVNFSLPFTLKVVNFLITVYTEKHFPTEDALRDYLEGRGIALEKIC